MIMTWLENHQYQLTQPTEDAELEKLKDYALEGLELLIQKPFLENGAIGPGTCLHCKRQHRDWMTFDATQINMFDKAIHNEDCPVSFLHALLERIKAIEAEQIAHVVVPELVRRQ